MPVQPYSSSTISFSTEHVVYLAAGGVIYQFAINQIFNSPPLPEELVSKVVCWFRDIFNAICRTVFSIYFRHQIADARNEIFHLVTSPSPDENELIESVLKLSAPYKDILPEFAFFYIFYSEKLQKLNGESEPSDELSSLTDLWLERGYVFSSSNTHGNTERAAEERPLFEAFASFCLFEARFLKEDEVLKLAHELVTMASLSLNRGNSEAIATILTETFVSLFPGGIDPNEKLVDYIQIELIDRHLDFGFLKEDKFAEVSFKDRITLFILFSLTYKKDPLTEFSLSDALSILRRRIFKIEDLTSSDLFTLFSSDYYDYLDQCEEIRIIRDSVKKFREDLVSSKVLYDLFSDQNGTAETVHSKIDLYMGVLHQAALRENLIDKFVITITSDNVEEGECDISLLYFPLGQWISRDQNNKTQVFTFAYRSTDYISLSFATLNPESQEFQFSTPLLIDVRHFAYFVGNEVENNWLQIRYLLEESIYSLSSKFPNIRLALEQVLLKNLEEWLEHVEEGEKTALNLEILTSLLEAYDLSLKFPFLSDPRRLQVVAEIGLIQSALIDTVKALGGQIINPLGVIDTCTVKELILTAKSLMEAL